VSEPQQRFDEFDRVVACSEFVAEELRSALGEPGSPPISVIPFGVDTSAFFPVTPADGGSRSDASAAAKARLGLLPEAEIPGSFIVLNANRNQPRKRIDSTIRAFSRFAEGKPKNVRLYLHMGLHDAGWDVVKLARRFGIEDRLILSSTGDATPFPAVQDADLNWIYNACDVGVNTSVCEGWGLVSFEHAATHRAQVVTDLPSLRGLWEGSAVMAPANRSAIMERTLLNEYFVDEVQLASILERLYRDEPERERWAEAGYRNAMRPEYNWDAVALQWEAVFQKLIS
jgi:glycosyltransferase involved in cell wall biosynthesis